MADNDDLKRAERAIERARHDLEEAEAAVKRAAAGEPANEQPVAENPAASPTPETQQMPQKEPVQEAQSPPAAPAQPQETPAQPAAPQEPPAQATAAAPVQGSPAASGGKWRVEFLRDDCIGAGACVAANADFWSIDDDGKATLKSAQFDKEKNVWVLNLEDETQLQKQRDAAGVCPVNVIHIYDPDGNQEI